MSGTEATAVLAEALVDLADTMNAPFDCVDLLARLADHVTRITSADEAGIMLVDPSADNGGRLRVVASSSERMRLLELFELQYEEGPCFECHATGQPVVNVMLAGADQRWPRFASEAFEAGYRTVHALPLRLRDRTVGVLNAFVAAEQHLAPAEVRVVQALADVAAIAILQRRVVDDVQEVVDQLSHALESRVVIEQAKGRLTERLGIDMDAAYRALRSYARGHSVLLSDVARSVVTGVLSAEAITRPRPERR